MVGVSALAFVLLSRNKVVAARLGAGAAVGGAFLALFFVGALRANAQRAPSPSDPLPPAQLSELGKRDALLSFAALGFGLLSVQRARRS
jgi:hypothetical protein